MVVFLWRGSQETQKRASPAHALLGRQWRASRTYVAEKAGLAATGALPVKRPAPIVGGAVRPASRTILPGRGLVVSFLGVTARRVLLAEE
ncbi:hypothetical protein MPNT_60103 [Candidatus Methylacidithermus pantelleriae]|uniref:Uncharacterized protein n=1 Tax=Candidatus Methylacidithermus pantelleriae TaxID=2744239 RepID=A0A8J2FPM5_9BACT|nr:hypothetical protein MPNT_60103 [Candidatus Methylacidithermus pantelleriae]